MSQKGPFNDLPAYRQANSGSLWFKKNYSAGVAFLEILRKDEKGIQLSRPDQHEMIAIVGQGLQGWVWTTPGSRSQQTLTNPIWIVVNAFLRAKGLRFASAATAETAFDVDAAIAAADICDTTVDKLVGSGSETQFKFRGYIAEQKPLQQWIREILMNCLGYYSFAFGKLKPGVRVNSSVIEAFTKGNILFNSLNLKPVKPRFNKLLARYGDEERGETFPGAKDGFQENAAVIYDEDHALKIGGATTAVYQQGEINLAGCYRKSHAHRILITTLREELGGVDEAEQKQAREIRLLTTMLAVNVEPGMVCSLTHEDMPGARGTVNTSGTAVSWVSGDKFTVSMENNTMLVNGIEYTVATFTDEDNIVLASSAGSQSGVVYKIITGEFRCIGWRLNPDFSLEIVGRTTTDAMYDYAIGPKPEDVLPDDVPQEIDPSTIPFPWGPGQVKQEGSLAASLIPVTRYNFGMVQRYDTAADGTSIAKIIIAGKAPVNKITDAIRRPRIEIIGSTATTGGFLAGGETYYFGVSAIDADGKFTLLSDIGTVTVPPTTNTNTITLTVIDWDPVGVGWYLWFGRTRETITLQPGAQYDGGLSGRVTVTGTEARPDTITFLGGNDPVNEPLGYFERWLGPPDQWVKELVIRARHALSLGVAGSRIEEIVDSTHLRLAPDPQFTTNVFAGRFVSLIGRIDPTLPLAEGGGMPLIHLLISGNTGDTLELAAGQSNVFAELDFIVIRTKATSVGSDAGGNYIEDTGYTEDPGAVLANAIGNMILFISGPGIGESYLVQDVVNQKLYIDGDWITTPTTSSVFVIVQPHWLAEKSTEELSIESIARFLEMEVELPNQQFQQTVFQVFTRGANGAESHALISPWRDIILFGQAEPNEVIDVDTSLDQTQGFIEVDTASGPKSITLPSPSTLPGRNLVIGNIGASGNDVTLLPAAGETIGGQSSLILKDGELIFLKGWSRP